MKSFDEYWKETMKEQAYHESRQPEEMAARAAWNACLANIGTERLYGRIDVLTHLSEKMVELHKTSQRPENTTDRTIAIAKQRMIVSIISWIIDNDNQAATESTGQGSRHQAPNQGQATESSGQVG